MAIADEFVKTLKNPTPLYAVAGTADLAAEKLREVPALIDRIRTEAPERIERIRSTDPKVVQERVTAQAKDAQTKAQAKVGEMFGAIDLDLKKLRDTAQDVAMQGVGRAAEYAVRAREAYDGLAERGKGAVATWRGDAAEQVEDLAVAIEGEYRPETAKPSAPPVSSGRPAGGKKAPDMRAPGARPTGAKPTAKLGE